MGLLEKFFFAIKKYSPQRVSRFDAVVANAIQDFEDRHRKTVDCLVCQAIKAGANPKKIRIVQSFDEGMLSIKVTYVDEKGRGVWLE